MKKFIKLGIYGSLGIVVLAYLFVTLHWRGGTSMILVGSALHVLFYMANAIVDKENTQNFVALAAFIGLVLISYFRIVPGVIPALLFVSYVGYHLLPNNKLASTTNFKLRRVALMALSGTVIAILFKVLHWPGADMILLVTMAVLAMLIAILGFTKGNSLQAIG